MGQSEHRLGWLDQNLHFELNWQWGVYKSAGPHSSPGSKRHNKDYTITDRLRGGYEDVWAPIAIASPRLYG